jgi:hypothetical protein
MSGADGKAEPGLVHGNLRLRKFGIAVIHGSGREVPQPQGPGSSAKDQVPGPHAPLIPGCGCAAAWKAAHGRPSSPHQRKNSPLENREVRLRGLYLRVPRAATRDGAGRSPGCGRATAWGAANRRAAESTQVDFAFSQRRIHSLLEVDCAQSGGLRVIPRPIARSAASASFRGLRHHSADFANSARLRADGRTNRRLFYPLRRVLSRPQSVPRHLNLGTGHSILPSPTPPERGPPPAPAARRPACPGSAPCRGASG